MIKHILEYGHITTEDLQNKYGYDHPPRAARDVREQGIPLETFKVLGAHGRQIAAYRFGDLSKTERHKLGGRRAWPKGLKNSLLAESGSRCAVCSARYSGRELQIDHRVPYEIAGESALGDDVREHVMLVCGSCNRAKSWTCEHCDNVTGARDPSLCKECYWGSPERFSHIALRSVRRADIVWSNDEVGEYDRVAGWAAETGERVPAFIKKLLRKTLPTERDPDE